MLKLLRLFESFWHGGTYARFVTVAGMLLVGAVSVREAPIVRSLMPVRQIAPRQAFTRNGRVIRISGIRPDTEARITRPNVAFVVEMTASSDEHWQLAPADLRLEFEGGATVAAFPPDLARRETSLIFAPGVERTALVRFPQPANSVNALPVSILLHRPRARFMLEPG
jgi:hypothetical protein